MRFFGRRVRLKLLLLAGLALSACGIGANSRMANPPATHVGPARGPVLPIAEVATWSATPAPLTQIPFAFPPGPDAQVCVFDWPRRDVFVYPGTGPGVVNLSVVNPGQYLYDDLRNSYLYDAWREEQVILVDGREVGGFAFFPSMTAHYTLYFIGQSDPRLAAQLTGFAYVKLDEAASPSVSAWLGGSEGASPEASPSESPSPAPSVSPAPSPSPSPSPSAAPSEAPTPSLYYATSSSAPSVTIPPPDDISARLGKPRFLTKINALAVLHGGVTSISVNIIGDAVVFTTGDGGLYLYTPFHPQVVALLPEAFVKGRFHAAGATIDPIWGRYVVWRDTALQGLFVLDRWTGQIDPVPYTRLGIGLVAVIGPSFFENDPFNVVFVAVFEDGTLRLMAYNILTEQLLNLTLLNMLATGVRAPVDLSR